MGHLLQRAANHFGDSTAAVFCGQKIRKTFSQLLQDVMLEFQIDYTLKVIVDETFITLLLMQADQAAAGFLSLGLKRGDRIGIWGPNSYECKKKLHFNMLNNYINSHDYI